MTQLLNNKNDIIAWLEDRCVKNYQLNRDKTYGFVVDVEGHVNLTNGSLRAIPVKFRHVSGTFDCESNYLTSLLGVPNTVGGGFNCGDNCLTSLRYAPETVGSHFYCWQNRITSLKGLPSIIGGSLSCDENRLTSLKHSPSHIKGFFSCNVNRLTSLQFCPQTVEEDFYCDNNDLASFEFCPKTVRGNFICQYNPLLGETQEITDFDKIHQIHMHYVDIKLEKNHLLEHINATQSSLKTHKI